MAFSFTQTSITARTAAVAAHNRGLDNGLQGTTGVGQCGIFGPAPPREPTPSAPQFTKPPCIGGVGKKAPFVPPAAITARPTDMAFRISAGIFVLVCPAGWRWRVADARVGAHELHPGQVQSGPGSGVERSKEKEKITAGIGA